MKEVSYSDFKRIISADAGIDVQREYVLNLPADRKTIKNFTTGVAHSVRIFDGENEVPYMRDHFQRDNEAFARAVQLRCRKDKTLSQIEREAGVSLRHHNVTICEGGGWTSKGTRYIYKDIYCEI